MKRLLLFSQETNGSSPVQSLKSQLTFNLCLAVSKPNAEKASSESSEYVTTPVHEGPASVVYEDVAQKAKADADGGRSSYLAEDVQQSLSEAKSQIVGEQTVVSVASVIVPEPTTPRSGPISDFVDELEDDKQAIVSEIVA